MSEICNFCLVFVQEMIYFAHCVKSTLLVLYSIREFPYSIIHLGHVGRPFSLQRTTTARTRCTTRCGATAPRWCTTSWRRWRSRSRSPGSAAPSSGGSSGRSTAPATGKHTRQEGRWHETSDLPRRSIPNTMCTCFLQVEAVHRSIQEIRGTQTSEKIPRL